MDLTKLLSLLETRKLFFPRSDKFEDLYEGAESRATISEMLKSGMSKELVEKFICSSEKQKQKMFISCWHMSEHESAAIWNLYLKTSEGIAIRSDHDTLCQELINSNYMARTSIVKYIDYDKTVIPADNSLFLFLHKRLSFAHENELRAIIWSLEDKNLNLISLQADSVSVDINPENLIKAIHIAPNAPQWFSELVEQLIARYGLRCPIERSNLYDRPTY